MRMLCVFVAVYVRHGGHKIIFTGVEAKDSISTRVYCGGEDTAQAKRFSVIGSVT